MPNIIISEVQTKTTMKDLCTPARMAKIKKIVTNVGVDVESLEHSPTVGKNIKWCNFASFLVRQNVKQKLKLIYT
jgi:hypothetical protein